MVMSLATPIQKIKNFQDHGIQYLINLVSQYEAFNRFGIGRAVRIAGRRSSPLKTKEDYALAKELVELYQLERERDNILHKTESPHSKAFSNSFTVHSTLRDVFFNKEISAADFANVETFIQLIAKKLTKENGRSLSPQEEQALRFLHSSGENFTAEQIDAIDPNVLQDLTAAFISDDSLSESIQMVKQSIKDFEMETRLYREELESLYQEWGTRYAAQQKVVREMAVAAVSSYDLAKSFHEEYPNYIENGTEEERETLARLSASPYASTAPAVEPVRVSVIEEAVAAQLSEPTNSQTPANVLLQQTTANRALLQTFYKSIQAPEGADLPAEMETLRQLLQKTNLTLVQNKLAPLSQNDIDALFFLYHPEFSPAHLSVQEISDSLGRLVNNLGTIFLSSAFHNAFTATAALKNLAPAAVPVVDLELVPQAVEAPVAVEEIVPALEQVEAVTPAIKSTTTAQDLRIRTRINYGMLGELYNSLQVPEGLTQRSYMLSTLDLTEKLNIALEQKGLPQLSAEDLSSLRFLYLSKHVPSDLSVQKIISHLNRLKNDLGLSIDFETMVNETAVLKGMALAADIAAELVTVAERQPEAARVGIATIVTAVQQAAIIVEQAGPEEIVATTNPAKEITAQPEAEQPVVVDVAEPMIATAANPDLGLVKRRRFPERPLLPHAEEQPAMVAEAQPVVESYTLHQRLQNAKAEIVRNTAEIERLAQEALAPPHSVQEDALIPRHSFKDWLQMVPGHSFKDWLQLTARTIPAPEPVPVAPMAMFDQSPGMTLNDALVPDTASKATPQQIDPDNLIETLEAFVMFAPETDGNAKLIALSLKDKNVAQRPATVSLEAAMEEVEKPLAAEARPLHQVEPFIPKQEEIAAPLVMEIPSLSNNNPVPEIVAAADDVIEEEPEEDTPAQPNRSKRKARVAASIIAIVSSGVALAALSDKYETLPKHHNKPADKKPVLTSHTIAVTPAAITTDTGNSPVAVVYAAKPAVKTVRPDTGNTVMELRHKLDATVVTLNHAIETNDGKLMYVIKQAQEITDRLEKQKLASRVNAPVPVNAAAIDDFLGNATSTLAWSTNTTMLTPVMPIYTVVPRYQG